MPTGTYGDFARWTTGARHGASLKSKMDTLSLELASGQKHDLAEHLGTATQRLGEIDDMLGRISALNDNATMAEAILNTQQLALAKFDGARSNLATAILQSGPNLTATDTKTLSQEAKSAFSAMISSLNTKTAGRFVFAGSEPGSRPVSDSNLILNDLRSTIDFTQSASAIAAEIDAYFLDPTGPFATTQYSGGSPSGMDVQVGQNIDVNTGSTAMDLGLRSALAKTALVAILDEVPNRSTQAELVHDSAGRLNSDTGTIQLRANIGSDQAAIDKERAYMAGEAAALTIERNKRVSADQFETATKLKQAEIQLQVHFTLLSRMSQLSLVNFT